jgi:broad specificity phosphatase PhoE
MSISLTYFPHGTTTDNENGVSSGWDDAELSEKGIEQSIALKDKIGSKKFDVIFCSDLKRAVDSGKLAFEGMAPIIPDARLRECNYGDITVSRHRSSSQCRKR